MICTHLSRIRPVQPATAGCQECMELGMGWVELRLCLQCGHVGCCNGSQGQHALRHFEETGHPIIRSYQSGRDWSWCHVDRTYVEPESIDQAIEAAVRYASRLRAARGAAPPHIPGLR